MSRKGFTLVEIMIVMAVLGILAAIAIPNFMKARVSAKRSVCLANMKKIEQAKTLFALDEWLVTGEACTIGDIVPGYLKNNPRCPSDPAKGDYVVNPIGTRPACPVVATHPDHVLP